MTTVGETKDRALASLIDTYLTRLGPFAKVDRTVIKAAGGTEKAKAIREENASLRNAIKEEAVTVLLTEHGKTFDSATFATWLERISESGARPVQFLVAGPYGVEKETVEVCDHSLSLSPLTMPHELALAVLCEQLYRACTILKGKTYHY